MKFPLLCGDRDETLPKIKFTNNSSDTSCRGTDESEDLADVERFSKASYISALLYLYKTDKGQMISEQICGVLKFSKKATKYSQDFCPTL